MTAWTKRYFGFSELLQEGTRRMQYSAIVFDLDGTLLDTLADIAEAANRVLVQHGFPAHEL
ncbi:MAG: HAD hydrolase-like protein, partial [Pirellulaceae bacterium]|nr:HAD hydrolase-like protein [Pirellulaceae bacterium]